MASSARSVFAGCYHFAGLVIKPAIRDKGHVQRPRRLLHPDLLPKELRRETGATMVCAHLAPLDDEINVL